MKKSTKLLVLTLPIAYLSYLIFISFQGFLTLLSKQGTLIFPLIGITLNMIAIPSLVHYIYGIFINEKNNDYRFIRYYAYLLTLIGTLSLIFMIYEMIYYFNLGVGITPLYPLNYLLIDLLITGLGIYNFIKLKSLDKNETSKDIKFIYRILFVLFTFTALDRLGGVLTSFIEVDFNQILILLPIYLMSLSLIITLITNIICEKKNLYLALICISSIFLISGFTYQMMMLYGNNATPFIKMLSPFYGFDRITSIPLTLTLIPTISVLGIVYSIIKFIKIKKISK